MLSKLNKKLSIISFYTIISSILLISIYDKGVTDPFLHGHISTIIKLINNPNIKILNSDMQFWPLAAVQIIIFNLLFNISPITIQFLPLIGLLFVITFPLLLTRFFPLAIGILLSLIVLSSWILPYNYSVWPHAFGYYLFFILIYIIYTFYTIKNSRYIILIIILFIAINFYSYSTSVWSLSFLTFIILFNYLYNTFKYKSNYKFQPFALLIAMFVIYFGFNKIVYESYFSNLYDSVGESSIWERLNIFNNLLISDNIKTIYYTNTNSEFISYLGLIRFLIIFIPIVYFLIYILRNKDELISKQYYVFIPSMLFISIIDILSYTSVSSNATSSILFRYYSLMAPIAVFFSISALMKKSQRRVIILTIYASLILLLSIIILFSNLYSTNIVTSNAHFNNEINGIEWTIEHRAIGSMIISDHHTVGRTLIVSNVIHSDLKLYQDVSYYNDYLFENFISNKKSIIENKSTLIIVNNEIEIFPTSGNDWINYQPLLNYKQNYTMSEYNNKVFDDSNIRVFFNN